MNNFASDPYSLPTGSFATGQAEDPFIGDESPGTFADQWTRGAHFCVPAITLGSFADVEYSSTPWRPKAVIYS